jgi:uncharacterized protein
VKIFGLLLLVCAAPVAITARQSSGTSAQATPNQSTPGAQSSNPAAKPTVAIDPAKEAAIRRLFEVQGTKDTMSQVIASMSATVRPLLESSLPRGEYRAQLIDLFFQRFQAKMSVNKLLDLAIPVYDKYFSLEDIEGLTKFYQTPLGKKAISVLPQVLLETQAAGKKYGEEVGRQSMMDVLEEHPDLKKSLEDAGAAPKN